jgi:hypothetical protein
VCNRRLCPQSCSGPARRPAIHYAVAAALLIVSAALYGCSHTGRARLPPLSQRVVESVIPAHNGEHAIVYWRDATSRRRGASLVAFRTRRETVLGTGDLAPTTVGDWSPDDHAFAGARKRRGWGAQGWTVGILDPETGQWRPIPQPQGLAPLLTSWPTWSPDGERVVFWALADTGGAEFEYVCLYQPATDKSWPLATGRVYKSGRAFWGDGVVLSQPASSADPGSRGRTRGRFFYRDTGRPGTIGFQKELLPDLFVERMSVSPDGSKAAALCLPESANREDEVSFGGYRLYVVESPETPRSRRLSEGLFEGGSLEWSGQGDRILVYEARAPNDLQPPTMVIVDAATGTARPLRDTSGRPLHGVKAHWVNGDKEIIYVGGDAGGATVVWRYEVSSGARTRLSPW